MVDIFSRRKRSEIMRKIGPENSSIELNINNILKSLYFSFHSHDKSLPGKPDFVFLLKKKIIFVNGCFWHGHQNCRRSVLPTTNKKFWKDKISSNILRDKSNYRKLNRMGWSYKVLWQCRLVKKSNNEIAHILTKFLR
ncbi:MAG: very short patch repair endonuclease [Bacteroidota bacterium]